LRLLTHWGRLLSDGTLKLNTDVSFLESYHCLGVGGLVRNYNGGWIFGFSHYEVGGDASLAELRPIQMSLDFVIAKTIRTLLLNVIA